jgi:hypothetical protein
MDGSPLPLSGKVSQQNIMKLSSSVRRRPWLRELPEVPGNRTPSGVMAHKDMPQGRLEFIVQTELPGQREKR